MVSLAEWEEPIKRMAAFYLAIDVSSLSQSDKVSAALAKESASDIIDLVEKYKRKPSSTLLKQIHANLRTLGRGVEGFDDQLINAQHHKHGEFRYDLLDFLEKSIRW